MKKTLARQRSRRFERLESRNLLAAAVINEVLYETLGTAERDKFQYVELRGEPSGQLPQGSYLVTVNSKDGLNNSEGEVTGIFDLSGLSFGSNGFLVFLPQGSSFQPDSAATTLRSSTPGFGGLPGNRYTDSDGTSDSLSGLSTSYFLIQTDVSPQLGDDIDADSDGLVDPEGVISNWNVLDSITVVDALSDAHGYGEIVFAHTTGVLFPEVTVPPGRPVIRPDGGGYVGRIGNSTGSTADDWVGGAARDFSGDQYFVRINNDIVGRPRPIFLHGRELDHLGSENFVGAARLSFFNDANNNGVFDNDDTPLAGARVFADSNGNGVRDNLETIIEPSSFDPGTELNNLTPGVTLSIANADNSISGFRVTAEEVTINSSVELVFAHAGIPYMNNIRKLRADFYRPARSVSVDVIGNSDLTATYGRIEAYDVNGNLLQMIRGSGLAEGQRQTLTISRATDEIAYILAYSDNDYLNSSAFGRFDRLRFTVPEASGVAGADGSLTLNYLDPGNYTIYPQTSVLDDYVFNRPSFTIDKYENFTFLVPANLNAPPVFNAATLSVAENSPTGTIAGTISASDHPSQTLSFTLLTATDRFTLDANTGVLRVRQGAQLNFESTPTINITVRVSDNAVNPLSTTQQFTVNLTDVNEPPNLPNIQFEVDENVANGTLIGTLVGSDVDSGNNGTLRYRLTGNVPGQAVSIDATTGQLFVNQASFFNFEARTQFVVTAEVFDQGQPSLSDPANVTILIRNLNEPPTILTNEMAVGELSPPGTLVGTVQLSDPETDQFHTFGWAEGFSTNQFIIDQFSGQISVAENASLSFAEQPEIVVQVSASDSGSPVLSSTKNITIRIVDQNNPPVIEDVLLNVDENSSAGTVVGTVTVLDPDLNQGHVFAIGTSPGQDLFEIGQTSGVITVKPEATLNFEEQSQWVVLIQVSDTGIPSASSTRELTITINDINEAPDLDPIHQLSVGENSAPLTVVGQIPFSDPDAGDTALISFVSGNQLGLFRINVETGVVTVAEGADLDFEEVQSYVLGLEATDGKNTPRIALLTITIEDRNDPPTVSGQAEPLQSLAGIEFDFALPQDLVVDQDAGQSFSWELRSAAGELPQWLSFDASSAAISGQPWNANVGSYQLILTATDSGSPPLSVDVPVTLEVTNNGTPWTNPSNRLNVNNDTGVNALDALVVINYLNRSGETAVEPLVNFRPAFLDVNGNNFIEALDALVVINHLNRNEPTGEGEDSYWDQGVAVNFGPASAGFAFVAEDHHRRRLMESEAVDRALLEFRLD